MTHICVIKPTITGSDNGLSPSRRQASIWANVGMLLIWPLGTNFIEMLFLEVHIFSFMEIHLNISSVKCRPVCLGLNVLTCPLLRSVRSWLALLSLGCCSFRSLSKKLIVCVYWYLNASLHWYMVNPFHYIRGIIHSLVTKSCHRYISSNSII